MNITFETLISEVQVAIDAWPFIIDVEKRHRLPAYLLYAVGSRETNLVDESGDGGHGRGVWQRDDRFWHIPSPYPVQQQANDAATLLRADLDYFHGDVHKAVASYNCGPGGVDRAVHAKVSPDTYTTGGNYGADVLERLSTIVKYFVTTERGVA